MPLSCFEPQPNWVREEFDTVSLGDKRLNERMITVTDAFLSRPQLPINAASEDWASTKATYRLFDNEKVTAEKIFAPHLRRTQQRVGSETQVFAVQDTTYLDYTSHRETVGLGPIGTKAQKIRGLVKHTTLLLGNDGLPLGVVTDDIWAREEADDDNGSAKPRTLEEKESHKWIAALRQTVDRVPSEVSVITICDREADFYDFFVEATALKTQFVLRAAYDRCVTDEMGKVRAVVGCRPPVGHLVVELPQREKQPARRATVEVRFTKVTLRPPHRTKAIQPSPLPEIDVSVVLVTELNPPAHVTPLDWLIVTNVDVTDFTSAFERVKWYSYRWQIEVYFKVLKSGCQVERCCLREKERLVRYLTLLSLIAWRLYWLTQINRHYPQAPCDLILAVHEWQALYVIIHHTTHLPTAPPTVGQAVRWIAQLGGFLGRKHDGHPGVTTIWRGWQRLSDISQIWSYARGS